MQPICDHVNQKDLVHQGWMPTSLTSTINYHFFQSAKVLVKKELAYVPVIGWMWYFLEIVFCKRKWEEDRITVSQSLQKLRDYPENFWVRHQPLKNLSGIVRDWWTLFQFP